MQQVEKKQVRFNNENIQDKRNHLTNLLNRYFDLDESYISQRNRLLDDIIEGQEYLKEKNYPGINKLDELIYSTFMKSLNHSYDWHKKEENLKLYKKQKEKNIKKLKDQLNKYREVLKDYLVENNYDLKNCDIKKFRLSEIYDSKIENFNSFANSTIAGMQNSNYDENFPFEKLELKIKLYFKLVVNITFYEVIWDYSVLDEEPLQHIKENRFFSKK
ncbi:MAG: hypothetical protein N4A49_10965 [Marinifilaceae bacterium]|jgi:hypothetical protein|nr:hypothetical protein [Marinifilaceae bacterium]